jgi:hypothetical protein
MGSHPGGSGDAPECALLVPDAGVLGMVEGSSAACVDRVIAMSIVNNHCT